MLHSLVVLVGEAAVVRRGGCPAVLNKPVTHAQGFPGHPQVNSS